MVEPTWTVKSKFIGDVAWFIDYADALAFVESNPSIHPEHYTVVEFSPETHYEYLATNSEYRRTGDSEEWAEVWRIRGYETWRRTKAVAAGEWEEIR